MKTMNSRRVFLGALFAALATTGCDESIFDVKNPGRILDDDLNTARGVTSLVTGMSADFSEGFDELAFTTAILSDEIVGSGSYFSTGRYRRGLFDSEDANGRWNDVQRARWVAEAGLLRMQAIEGYQYDGNENTARAHLFGGLANRVFGENFCQTVFSAPYDEENPGPGGEVDTGDAMDRNAAFQRAIPLLGAGDSARWVGVRYHKRRGGWSGPGVHGIGRLLKRGGACRQSAYRLRVRRGVLFQFEP